MRLHFLYCILSKSKYILKQNILVLPELQRAVNDHMLAYRDHWLTMCIWDVTIQLIFIHHFPKTL